jgi:hypothetical protein
MSFVYLITILINTNKIKFILIALLSMNVSEMHEYIVLTIATT